MQLGNVTDKRARTILLITELSFPTVGTLPRTKGSTRTDGIPSPIPLEQTRSRFQTHECKVMPTKKNKTLDKHENQAKRTPEAEQVPSYSVKCCIRRCSRPSKSQAKVIMERCFPLAIRTDSNFDTKIAETTSSDEESQGSKYAKDG